MAGDWIKMRGNLWDDPRIANLADATETSEATVIGALYWLWATADQHSQDGIMPGLSLRSIDRKTGVQGFGAALVDIGWLHDHPEGVRLARFDEHNGASAKTRAQTAKRVASHKGNAKVTPTALPESQDSVSSALPREEKRREEKEQEPKSKAETAQRASRLPADWSPSPDDLAFCQTERPELSPQQVAAEFRDYWTAKAGTDARKTDWSATWRNWVRRQKVAVQARASPIQSDKFHLSGVDRSGDNAVAEASRRKHGIVIDPTQEYEF